MKLFFTSALKRRLPSCLEPYSAAVDRYTPRSEAQIPSGHSTLNVSVIRPQLTMLALVDIILALDTDDC